MKITLGQFIDNIEKNGFPQIKGALWGYRDYGVPVADIRLGGCALGQGFYNTFKSYEMPINFWGTFPRIKFDENSPEFSESGETFEGYTAYMNDNLGLTLPEIAAKLRAVYFEHLDEVVYTK